ncbi:MAG TPA: hypothetical protein PLH34_08015 [Bacillota bacterium]|nr:hypothetical protein [Bacillota bacterium]
MKSRRLRVAGILSLLWGGWWTFFGLASGISEGIGILGTLMHALVPGLIFLATALTARKRNFVGGIFLVLEGVLALWFFGYLSDRLFTPLGLQMVLFLGLPGVASGLLFISEGTKPGSMHSRR